MSTETIDYSHYVAVGFRRAQVTRLWQLAEGYQWGVLISGPLPAHQTAEVYGFPTAAAAARAADEWAKYVWVV